VAATRIWKVQIFFVFVIYKYSLLNYIDENQTDISSFFTKICWFYWNVLLNAIISMQKYA